MEEKVAALTEEVRLLNLRLTALTTAFATKLQWKQLDTQRAGEIETVASDLSTLSSDVRSIAARVSLLETA